MVHLTVGLVLGIFAFHLPGSAWAESARIEACKPTIDRILTIYPGLGTYDVPNVRAGVNKAPISSEDSVRFWPIPGIPGVLSRPTSMVEVRAFGGSQPSIQVEDFGNFGRHMQLGFTIDQATCNVSEIRAIPLDVNGNLIEKGRGLISNGAFLSPQTCPAILKSGAKIDQKGMEDSRFLELTKKSWGDFDPTGKEAVKWLCNVWFPQVRRAAPVGASEVGGVYTTPAKP